MSTHSNKLPLVATWLGTHFSIHPSEVVLCINPAWFTLATTFQVQLSAFGCPHSWASFLPLLIIGIKLGGVLSNWVLFLSFPTRISADSQRNHRIEGCGIYSHIWAANLNSEHTWKLRAFSQLTSQAQYHTIGLQYVYFTLTCTYPLHTGVCYQYITSCSNASQSTGLGSRPCLGHSNNLGNVSTSCQINDSIRWMDTLLHTHSTV